MAPMEEVTGYVFRNVYKEMFGDISKYFSPFITTVAKGRLKTRDEKDVRPEHNANLRLVPQILTNRVDTFMQILELLYEMGYREYNLNLGCPSGTVVSKRRGSGMFMDLPFLDAFLDELLEAMEEVHPGELSLSVKMRIGLNNPEELEEILPIIEKKDLKEVIVHPRVREEFYKGVPHLEAYALAEERLPQPICYNGDLWTLEDYERLRKRFTKTHCWMLGRGIVANPALIRQIRGGEPLRKEEFELFIWKIWKSYVEELGQKDALFKMKELWNYFGRSFEDSKKVAHQIQKLKHADQYEGKQRELFANAKWKGTFNGKE